MLRLLFISLATAGLIWHEPAKVMCGLVLLVLIMGKPRKVK